MSAWRATVERLGPPHLELTWEDLERFRGAIVYVWTRDEEVLYVGMSTSGVERPIARGHEYLRDFRPGDRLTIWRVTGGLGAVYDTETMLIQHLRPRFNQPNGGAPCPECGGRWKRRDRAAGRCSWCQRKRTNLAGARADLEAAEGVLDMRSIGISI